ncbi:MAG TPA: hypothetical protein VLU23_06100, partial [Pseudolabrys sp.]|nr:hypothetical protein [Pseudolabrys sp.]
FRRSRALRSVICAKFFARVDQNVAINNDAKHSAQRAKMFRPTRARSERVPLQKPLFHRAFLISSRARAM